ncbi:MAG: 3-isopropylmalate dehydrogenase [Acidobacteriota bacterium]
MNARVVVLPGDGIGPEVVDAALGVLAAAAEPGGHRIDLDRHAIGGAAIRQHGTPLPADTLSACRSADAVLLGAVGDPAFDQAPRHLRPERGLLDIRKALGVYANLRPARLWPGLESTGPLRAERVEGTDLIFVRELTGGLYFGEPRGIDAQFASAVNTMAYSRLEVERVAEHAFRLAARRRRRLTSVDKANVLEVSQLWRRVVEDVAARHPDVVLDHMYVDACAMALALDPRQFDVVLTENLFGDILSDEAGAIVGSLGLLPSASLGDGVGLFEPVHGSAPTLAGRDVANPIGMILSVAMMLRHGLRLEHEASAVEQAVASTLAGGARTADLVEPGRGSAIGCREMARLIADRVRVRVSSTVPSS